MLHLIQNQVDNEWHLCWRNPAPDIFCASDPLGAYSAIEPNYALLYIPTDVSKAAGVQKSRTNPGDFQPNRWNTALCSLSEYCDTRDPTLDYCYWKMLTPSCDAFARMGKY